jgi:SAM-dependent methyltransferase
MSDYPPVPDLPDPTAIDPDRAITAIAPFYDLDFGAIDDDLPLYTSLAQRGHGRILELGAATGRLAIPLAHAGHTVTALENNDAMRHLGAARMRDAGVTLLAHDIRDFRLDERFDLIICALSTFCHLLTPLDQHRTLTAIARHLAPDGLTVIDLPALTADDWERGPRPLQLEWVRTDPRTHRTITKLATLQAEPATQTQYVTYLYDEHCETTPQSRDTAASAAPLNVQRTLAQFPLRHVFRFEMEYLLRAAGLTATGWYGTYDLDPPSHGERLIVTAQRPAVDQTAADQRVADEGAE